MKKSKRKILKPSRELQKAIDLFPQVIKQKKQVAKKKAKIRKNFESVRHKIFEVM